MSSIQHKGLSTELCAGYATGMVGAQVFRDIPALLLVVFMTNYLAIDPVLAAITVALPKLWVFIADPLAGSLSDRTRSRWGRRRPWLFWGALASIPAFLLMFNVPGVLETPLAKSVWVGVTYTIALTGFAAYSIPYITMAAELSPRPEDRTRLVSFRVVGQALGLILSASAPLIVAYSGGGLDGYSVMSLALGALCLATMLVPFFATRHAPLIATEQSATPIGQQFRMLVGNRPFLWLVLANHLQRWAEAIGYTTLAFFIIYVLKADLTLMLPFILAMCTGSISGQPAWVWLSKKLGKFSCYWLALLGYVGIYSVWFLATPDWTWQIYLLAFFNGVTNAGFLLMAQAMLTDTIQHARITSGEAREGLFSGIWFANEKIAFAIGTAIASFALAIVGFQESTAGTGAAQSNSVINGIAVIFVFLPVACHLASCLFLARYKLREADLDETARAF